MEKIVDNILKALVMLVFLMFFWVLINWVFANKEKSICDHAVNKQSYDCGKL